MSHIKFEFTREVMTNESENIANAKIEAETKQIEINTILNATAQIGDEKVLQAICDIMEWDFEELQGELEKIQEEQNLQDTKNALNNVVPEDEPPIDEPVDE